MRGLLPCARGGAVVGGRSGRGTRRRRARRAGPGSPPGRGRRRWAGSRHRAPAGCRDGAAGRPAGVTRRSVGASATRRPASQPASISEDRHGWSPPLVLSQADRMALKIGVSVSASPSSSNGDELSRASAGRWARIGMTSAGCSRRCRRRSPSRLPSRAVGLRRGRRRPRRGELGGGGSRHRRPPRRRRRTVGTAGTAGGAAAGATGCRGCRAGVGELRRQSGRATVLPGWRRGSPRAPGIRASMLSTAGWAVRAGGPDARRHPGRERVDRRGTPTGRDAGVRLGMPAAPRSASPAPSGPVPRGWRSPGGWTDGRNTVAVVPPWGLRRSITLMRWRCASRLTTNRPIRRAVSGVTSPPECRVALRSGSALSGMPRPWSMTSISHAVGAGRRPQLHAGRGGGVRQGVVDQLGEQVDDVGRGVVADAARWCSRRRCTRW